METTERIPLIDPQLESLLFSILLHSASVDSVPFVTPTQPLFHQLTTHSKGEALYANVLISRSTLIVQERPLVIWRRSIDSQGVWSLWHKMSTDAQRDFLQLSTNQHDTDGSIDDISVHTLDQQHNQIDIGRDEILRKLMAIKATNGFNVQLPILTLNPSIHVQSSLRNSLVLRQDDPSSSLVSAAPTHASFVFPLISRINHSCLPTADHCINWSTLHMQVYAVDNIESQKEITIEYLPRLIQRTKEERRKILRDTFNFDCQCELCGSTDVGTIRRSDERRKEIDELVKRVASREQDRNADLKAFAKIQTLLEEEGYKAMPEFDEPSVSNAFVFWTEMMRQQKATTVALETKPFDGNDYKT